MRDQVDGKTPARPVVYDYRDPQQFLRDTFNYLRSQDPSFSMRKWAAMMGLPSPKQLISILKRERKLKLRSLDGLRAGLALDSTEDLYFRALVQRANAVKAEELQLLDLLLTELSTTRQLRPRLIEASGLFSHWLHGALLSLGTLMELSASAEELTARFRWSVEPRAVTDSLALLLRLGLLEENPVTGGFTTTHAFVASRNEVTREDVHQYYRQANALADQAVDLPHALREFQYFNVTLGEDDIPVIKELLRASRRRIETAAEGRGDTVFQISLALFPVSHPVQPETATRGHRRSGAERAPVEERPVL